uniref:Importin N-terminal domain-containing protein n=1 Tax=Chromera velia CCMP2878 TaxID=1169474 RepID=A0A0G4F7P4_9ALVE|eukprot:Cvel_15452.t1-p1 / transcript=Cvel_15452.t1 / gene=Cvel_15452 / organism=Chromera_velia_CCMP2878 / gene_product=hypothetical protein / transcript_product=hypothetical protein / location=Cvel_scaffold1144:19971-31255(-) / protein_length=1206 / sequence_SO=supercontig / SO=protein_coding / is_pseudo=false
MLATPQFPSLSLPELVGLLRGTFQAHSQDEIARNEALLDQQQENPELTGWLLEVLRVMSQGGPEAQAPDALQVKQAAALAVKNRIRKFWTNPNRILYFRDADGFKKALFSLICEHPQIAVQIDTCLCLIACADFPESWPSLGNDLVGLLQQCRAAGAQATCGGLRTSARIAKAVGGGGRGMPVTRCAASQRKLFELSRVLAGEVSGLWRDGIAALIGGGGADVAVLCIYAAKVVTGLGCASGGLGQLMFQKEAFEFCSQRVGETTEALAALFRGAGGDAGPPLKGEQGGGDERSRLFKSLMKIPLAALELAPLTASSSLEPLLQLHCRLMVSGAQQESTGGEQGSGWVVEGLTFVNAAIASPAADEYFELPSPELEAAWQQYKAQISAVLSGPSCTQLLDFSVFGIFLEGTGDRTLTEINDDPMDFLATDEAGNENFAATATEFLLTSIAALCPNETAAFLGGEFSRLPNLRPQLPVLQGGGAVGLSGDGTQAVRRREAAYHAVTTVAYQTGLSFCGPFSLPQGDSGASSSQTDAAAVAGRLWLRSSLMEDVSASASVAAYADGADSLRLSLVCYRAILCLGPLRVAMAAADPDPEAVNGGFSFVLECLAEASRGADAIASRTRGGLQGQGGGGGVHEIGALLIRSAVCAVLVQYMDAIPEGSRRQSVSTVATASGGGGLLDRPGEEPLVEGRLWTEILGAVGECLGVSAGSHVAACLAQRSLLALETILTARPPLSRLLVLGDFGQGGGAGRGRGLAQLEALAGELWTEAQSGSLHPQKTTSLLSLLSRLIKSGGPPIALATAPLISRALFLALAETRGAEGPAEEGLGLWHLALKAFPFPPCSASASGALGQQQGGGETQSVVAACEGASALLNLARLLEALCRREPARIRAALRATEAAVVLAASVDRHLMASPEAGAVVASSGLVPTEGSWTCSLVGSVGGWVHRVSGELKGRGALAVCRLIQTIELHSSVSMTDLVASCSAVLLHSASNRAMRGGDEDEEGELEGEDEDTLDDTDCDEVTLLADATAVEEGGAGSNEVPGASVVSLLRALVHVVADEKRGMQHAEAASLLSAACRPFGGSEGLITFVCGELTGNKLTSPFFGAVAIVGAFCVLSAGEMSGQTGQAAVSSQQRSILAGAVQWFLQGQGGGEGGDSVFLPLPLCEENLMASFRLPDTDRRKMALLEERGVLERLLQEAGRATR